MSEAAKYQSGQLVYVGTDRRYLGRASVVAAQPFSKSTVVDSEGRTIRTYLVELSNGSRGLVAEDQMFTEMSAARAKATRHLFSGC